MVRSRSSFDYSSAITTATSLAIEPEERPSRFPGVALVSFGTPATEDGPTPFVPAPRSPLSAPAREAAGEATAEDGAPSSEHTTERPPKPPDLRSIVSPVARCERVVEWISEATSATEVFLADGTGLAIAGSAVAGAREPGAPTSAFLEARAASSGLVAHAVASLAAAIPGDSSPHFELSVGQQPVFQLLGFPVGTLLYLVGLTRAEPLSPSQVRAVRMACRDALGEPPEGGP